MSHSITASPARGTLNRRTAQLATMALVFGASVLVVLLLQVRNGIYGAELVYDESSHYVSGVMIHDYLVQHQVLSPVTFLRVFEGHYPLVGIGHWGPLYYVVEAVWMIFAGSSRASALVLAAVIAALIATCVHTIVARRFGAVLGAAAALLFLISPMVQSSAGEVMLDLPIALLCLLAALAYARFLDRPTALWSALFGLLAAAALLVKGNAACLALLPPLAVLIGRRFDLLSRWSFWLPVPIVLLLAAPWYAFTYGMVAAGFRYSWGLHYTTVAVADNARSLLQAVGPIVLALGLLGFLLVLVRRTRLALDGVTVSAASLLIAVWLFQIIVPAAIQSRYLVPDLPPLLFLSALATYWIIDRVVPSGAQRPRWQRDGAVLIGAAVPLLAILPYAAAEQPKQRLGIDPAVAVLWHDVDARNPTVLLATDGVGEVAALSSIVANRPKQPAMFVVRGSRLLGGGGYNTSEYRPRFATIADVQRAIDRYAIRFVLYRSTRRPGDWAHVQQVADAANAEPDRWKLLYRNVQPHYDVRLYEIKGNRDLRDGGRPLLRLSGPRAFRDKTAGRQSAAPQAPAGASEAVP
ncbi:MAG TPA: glycosyltransferase family 39 protein [Acetobacteraceae bacterium]|nr:glycosyltransferase family 39 protein [Acetobacteraceae bacterium]